MVSFEKIDPLLEEDSKKAFEELKQLYDSGESKNADVLWRLAKACHFISSNMEGKSPSKKETILKGRDYALAAYELKPETFSVVNGPILTGSSTDFLGIKDKIEQGSKFKEFLDKALSMDANEFSLLHMRGHFAYSVANLSWLERKAATAFFAAPPVATFDEALRDFELANKVKPGWITNIMFIARCHIAKKNNTSALPFLREILISNAESDSDREIIAEARQLVAKYTK